MTELDKALAAAYASEGKQDDVNKVYLMLLRSTLFLPVQKGYTQTSEEEEPFKPLFAKIDGNYILLVFDTLERLTAWAGDQIDQVNYVEVSGRDIVAGINEQVFLYLNYGSEIYKEFTPDEIKRVKTIVSRIDQLRTQ